MGKLYTEVGSWLKIPHGPITTEHVKSFRNGIAAWLKGATIEQEMKEALVYKPPTKAQRKEKRKREKKIDVERKHKLNEDPPVGWTRVYTDGSQQEGIDGKQYAGW